MLMAPQHCSRRPDKPVEQIVQRYIVVLNIGYPTTGNPPIISTEKWVEASWVEAGRCGPFADSWAMRAECLGVTLGAWPKQPASLPELGVKPPSLSLSLPLSSLGVEPPSLSLSLPLSSLASISLFFLHNEI